MKVLATLKKALKYWQNSKFDTYTRDALALARIEDFSYADITEPQQHPERVNLSGSLTVNWYLPSFQNAFYGGVMTILRTADYLQQKGGMRHRFLICADIDYETIKAQICKAFPSLAESEVIILNSGEAIANIPASDFSIATLWTTAYVLLKVKNTGLKFYFIQDFEPLFYPAGSTYAQTEVTYRFGFYGIANTISLKKIYESEYGGTAIHFTPCVDTHVFYPPESLQKNDEVKRIFFYGRPGHPRNGFELAIAAIRNLKQKYGDSIEILSAGANWNPEEYDLKGVVNNLGLLNYEATGELYRSCHIGLSMMMTRHPSYLPFEMMACGMLVVSNYNPSTVWLLHDGENCLLSHPSATCLFETISKAIDKYDSFKLIRNNAVQQIVNNYANWQSELDKIYKFIISVVPPISKKNDADQQALTSLKYNGALMQSNGDMYGSKVFYVKNRVRHYVPDLDWIKAHGFQWPEDIKNVSDEVISSFTIGRNAPRVWSLADWINPPKDSSLTMREIAASRLNGYGIEVGAGASPFPIPLHCDVRYVDRLDEKSLQDELYIGQDLSTLIKPDIVSDLESLDGIEDNSLDFIVACHTIEHTKNPLGALEQAYKKLRTDGSLVLVVPDKEKTFDKEREVTKLEHLILDYQSPSRERDKEHYVEFYQKAFKVSDQKLDSVVETRFQEEYAIHYHTWTYESFTAMVEYARNHICPWSSVWSQATLPDPVQDIEFYFVLTK